MAKIKKKEYSKEYLEEQSKRLMKYTKEELIDFLLESREQRDNYKILSFEFKRISNEYKEKFEQLNKKIRGLL